MQDSFAIAGNIKFINLSEIFQLLGANGNTGVLRITNRYSDTPGLIYFKNGNPIDAINGSLTGLDAVYSLFGWLEGNFEFKNEPVKNDIIIKKSRMQIMLDGSKMLDEGLIEKLGPMTYEKLPNDSDDAPSLPVVKGPLVDYIYVADEEDHREGDTILSQGKHGNWSWVVLAGTLEIRKETPGGQIPIIRVGVGSFIGSIDAFLTQGSVRSYSVVAVTDVQLGVLDSQRLSQENAIFSRNFTYIIKSLDKRLKQSTNLLSDVKQGKKKTDDILQGKKVLIKEGEKKEEFFVIEQGTAYIVRKSDDKNVVLARLEEGDFIGQLPFLNPGHEPDSASVYASEDLELRTLNAKQLQEEFEKLSATMKNIIDNTNTIITAISMMACKKYS